MDTAGKVLAFPAKPVSSINSIAPEALEVGDWFMTRGRVARGPGAWICWVVESAIVDHGGAVGPSLRAMPLVAPDGSWPYEHLELSTVYWVPLSDIEITMPMPKEGSR